jgi:flavin-dependent dehydrogenase|tara:strand:- start:40 stop:510 length:471 start_codon:yes stop_codon:yes gene_type:complete
MDPFTAMAAASAAFKGIKKAVEVGKEISSMGSTLSSWSKAVSDLDFLEQKAQKPPMYKMFSDTQSNALELWSHKQKLKEMREELRSHISFVYGPSAWDEIVRIEAQQRKEQRELVYKKQEALDNLINAMFIGAIVLAGVGALIALLYVIGAKQGRW